MISFLTIILGEPTGFTTDSFRQLHELNPRDRDFTTYDNLLLPNNFRQYLLARDDQLARSLRDHQSPQPLQLLFLARLLQQKAEHLTPGEKVQWTDVAGGLAIAQRQFALTMATPGFVPRSAVNLALVDAIDWRIGGSGQDHLMSQALMKYQQLIEDPRASLDEQHFTDIVSFQFSQQQHLITCVEGLQYPEQRFRITYRDGSVLFGVIFGRRLLDSDEMNTKL